MGLSDAELMKEMRLLLPNGTSLGGADALLEISRHFWWTWPIRQMARLPVILNLLRASYGWVARRRSCADGTCVVRSEVGLSKMKPHGRRMLDFVPLIILPLIAFGFRNHTAPWIFMWAMALAIFAGCKWLTFWLTYREVIRRGLKPRPSRSLAYLLMWPGMDAAGFLDRNRVPARPTINQWIFAAAKMMTGAILLWGVARFALPYHPILAGWIGMTGAIMVLHFGSFQLLALAWQRAGVWATPLMNKPILARSLAEFWSRRWNTAFNELAFRFTFRPLKRLTTPALALLLVFGLSGLIHELVLSLPARAGFGLPTIYFLIQGTGLLAERSRPGKAIGLGQGLLGWLFTVVVTAGPAFWLFNPPFITNVILPMLTAIGATGTNP